MVNLSMFEALSLGDGGSTGGAESVNAAMPGNSDGKVLLAIFKGSDRMAAGTACDEGPVAIIAGGLRERGVV